jgi:hypothetical protein
MKRVFFTLFATSFAALFAFGAACGGTNGAAPSSSNPPVDASVEAAVVDPYAAECANAAVPPVDIECTGLYANVATKALAAGVRAYAPAVPLWSDNASKGRWIFLPPGTTIDRTDPTEWIFPVGTKVWKEFSRNGKRIETRLFEKVQTAYWVRTTYAWNADESAASISGGGDFPLAGDGGTYHIPTPDECDQCHRGRNDHLLGFEEVSLGLAGATGLTLDTLASEGLLTPAPTRTHLTVGDDGTGVAAAPLAWIHINCGTSCHNNNSNSTAYGASMRLRLDPTQLDGRSSVDFDARRTTIGNVSTTPAWDGQTRIVAGDPSHSLLAKLITNRGTDNPVDNQMPPIASSLVDVPDSQNVIAWIAKMPAASSDAGPSSDGGAGADDAGADAGPSVMADASVIDAAATGDAGDGASGDGASSGDAD